VDVQLDPFYEVSSVDIAFGESKLSVFLYEPTQSGLDSFLPELEKALTVRKFDGVLMLAKSFGGQVDQQDVEYFEGIYNHIYIKSLRDLPPRIIILNN